MIEVTYFVQYQVINVK